MPSIALPLDVRQDADTILPGEVIENVPAIANAVEGASTNNVSPHKDSKDEKAKRREERRRQKEAERARKGASFKTADDVSHRELADSQDQMMREIENAQREASIQMPAPRDRSPQEQSITARESRSNLHPGHASQRTETKDERAKRKEEKRRRKMESRSA